MINPEIFLKLWKRNKRKISFLLIACLFLFASCRDNDSTPPVITLIGEEEMTLDQFDTFEEPGYKATDDRDGDLTTFVAIKGQVDESTAKIYTIRYVVNDLAGNFAYKVRTVTVVEQ